MDNEETQLAKPITPDEVYPEVTILKDSGNLMGRLLAELKTEMFKVPLADEESTVREIQSIQSSLKQYPGFMSGNNRVDGFRAGIVVGKKLMYLYTKQFKENLK